MLRIIYSVWKQARVSWAPHKFFALIGLCCSELEPSDIMEFFILGRLSLATLVSLKRHTHTLSKVAHEYLKHEEVPGIDLN